VFLGQWGSEGSGDGQFLAPFGVAVAPGGTVYVVEQSSRVQAFTADGAFLGSWGSAGRGNGQFALPHGIAVAPDGTVYVADTSNHRVQYFNPRGVYVGQWGREGSGPGQFEGADAIAVAADGTVYVSDVLNHRIQFFDAVGTYLGQWSTQDAIAGIGALTALAVSPDGMTVYAMSRFEPHALVFGAPGSFLRQGGSDGSDPGQMRTPSGVAVAVDGTVYVVDQGNNRIQAFCGGPGAIQDRHRANSVAETHWDSITAAVPGKRSLPGSSHAQASPPDPATTHVQRKDTVSSASSKAGSTKREHPTPSRIAPSLHAYAKTRHM
jgi:DNA-binding beta-propeller fold protein YncE